MKILQILSIAVLVLVLSACQSQVLIPEEILQIPRHTDLYTAYNIWYKDPMNISPENIQEGKILRFGTKVKIKKLTEDSVSFTAGNQTFQVYFSEDRTQKTPAEFVRGMFTTKTGVDLAAGVKPIIYEKMSRGVISEGMTRNEVLIACGPPIMTRTLSMESTTWVYWTGRVKSKRIIFKDNKVSAIFELD